MFLHIYIYKTYKYVLEKKDNKMFRTSLAALQVKFLSKIYIKLQVIWVILQVLHELQVIQKQYCCRKMYMQNNVFPFYFTSEKTVTKHDYNTSHNLKALSYRIPVCNLHYDATAETKIACYKMCTSYSTIGMKVSWLPLYKHVLKT